MTTSARPISDPTVVAIDWSGAAHTAGQRKHIWIASITSASNLELESNMTRDAVFEKVLGMPGPVMVGFDFSFGAPAWFARELGCGTIDDVWAAADRDGEQWLRAPAAPFWGKKPRPTCDLPAAQRFRACEERLQRAKLPAKSIFQLVGNGQVGPGSIRGMRMLPRLRAAGFAIWPFDAPAERTVFEIYPRAFRNRSRPELPPETATSRDAFDAAISALAMFEHRDTFATLRAATDETTRLEGDVWLPAGNELA